MNQKRILLLGGNYFPEPTGIGKYNGEMMNCLSGEGYECAVVTTYPYYPFWKVQQPYPKKSFWYSSENLASDGGNIRVYRCPHYIPSSPTGLRRMISDFSFFISAFFRVFFLLFARKYDYVIAVAPPFQLGLVGLFYKMFKNAKLIYHIQDLQIDAAKELNMIKSSWILKILFWLEAFILKRADYVSTISEGMSLKLIQKCNRPVIFFPNWVDTQIFKPLTSREGLKQKFKIDPLNKVVLYSGSIGEKQGIESLIVAAAALKHLNLTFVICGTGPYRNKLDNLVKKQKLSNVIFLPLQPKELFNDFLNMADVHLVLQKNQANDLVMPSKLSTILSVGGLALVTAAKRTSLYNIISRHDMGIVIEPENENVLIESIQLAVENSHSHMQKNARNYANKYLTMKIVIDRFLFETSITSPKRSRTEPAFRTTIVEPDVDLV